MKQPIDHTTSNSSNSIALYPSSVVLRECDANEMGFQPSEVFCSIGTPGPDRKTSHFTLLFSMGL